MQPQTIRRGDGGVDPTATKPVRTGTVTADGRGYNGGGGAARGGDPITAVTHSVHSQTLMKMELSLPGSGHEVINRLVAKLADPETTGHVLDPERNGHKVSVRYPAECCGNELEAIARALARS